jgi:hypothetical protein
MAGRGQPGVNRARSPGRRRHNRSLSSSRTRLNRSITRSSTIFSRTSRPSLWVVRVSPGRQSPARGARSGCSGNVFSCLRVVEGGRGSERSSCAMGDGLLGRLPMTGRRNERPDQLTGDSRLPRTRVGGVDVRRLLALRTGVVTSKETFCPSLSVLRPLLCIAEN